MSFSAPVRPVTGTYVGAGASAAINLGFQPIAVWVHSTTSTTVNRNGGFKSDQISGNTVMKHDGTTIGIGLTLTSTGFVVDTDPQFTWTGNNYVYTAWRG